MKLAIFASGSGTNAEAIICASKNGELDAEVVVVVCDKPGAQVIERAKRHGIEVATFDPKAYPSKSDYESDVVQLLKEKNVSYIALAGYMRLIGETLLQAYQGRIVNIHPSLLPSFPGLDAIGQAFEAKVKVTGVTIHFVDAGMDTGPIIAQEPVRIEPQETRETLQKKVQEIEHQMYPRTLQILVEAEPSDKSAR